MQVVGEVVSRLMLFALFAIMARRLGPGGFGDFTLALSLAGLMLLADSAIDDVLTRDVGRERAARADLAGDAVTAKLTIGGAVGALAIAFSFAGSYTWTVRGAVCLLVLGSLAELGVTTSYAMLQGLEDFRTSTLGLVIMRAARAAMGIIALLLGGGLLLVAATYAAGTVVALAYTGRALAARPDVPRLVWSRGATPRVVRRVWPLFAAGAVDTVLVSLAPIVLSAVKGADAVGAYGAAIRLALTTQFLAVALGTAVLPLFARSDQTSVPALGEMVQATLKVATAALLPVTAFLALFAAPVVTLVYGHDFASAVTPTRLLAGLAIARGIATIAFVVVLARDRLAPLVRIPAIVLVLDVALLAALIPTHAENGAAIAMLVVEVVYAGMLIVATVGLTGRISFVRIASGPIAGCIAMLIAAVALGTTAAGFGVALAGYAAVLLLWERALYPADLNRIAAVIRRFPATA